MKNLFFALLFVLFSATIAYSNGVAVIDAAAEEYLVLRQNIVDVEIDNQISIVKSTQVFQNIQDDSVKVKYAFPLPEDGSAIELKWFYKNQWRITEISPESQDTTFNDSDGEGGPNEPQNNKLEEYLGVNKVFYELPIKLGKNERITFEITYVDFLKYKMGEVKFVYKNDYTLIQNSELDSNIFTLTLNSERDIIATEVNVDREFLRFTSKNLVKFLINTYDDVSDYNININYTLSLDELGLFGLSTYLDNEIDSLGRGYFMFVAEPDPSETVQTLHKNFVLVIDESGSMTGGSGTGSYKMKDAKETAHYIIDNLNEGDFFNIISFDNSVKNFDYEMMPFNTENGNQAHKYVSSLNASGGTNISGALSEALNQFSTPEENYVNIIIFFTDGQATAGITNTLQLVNYINERNGEKNVHIFPFGIGNELDKQLLGLIADDNEGVVDFLADDDITEKITEFYNTIRNPVLINADIEFDPDIITEVAPAKLPNLYKGSQMIVSGRYNTTEYQWLDVKLKGKAFGQDVEYLYTMPLSNISIEENIVVPKIWAKQKIKDLMALYYRYPENSDSSKIIKKEIQDISIKYNILTEFTSFKGDQIIPVEFLTFDCFKTERGIELNWATASEINNLGFYVEKRNLTNKTEWERIVFINGNGTKNSISRYNYTDSDVSINNHYEYRINQIDIDGTGTNEVYSTVLSILFDANYSLNLLENYPNPMKDHTNFEYYIPYTSLVKIEIFDMKGRLVDTPVNEVLSGGKYNLNYISNNKLIPGGYYCILSFDSKTLLQKFVVE